MSEREPISGSSKDYGATAPVPNVGFADFSPTELYNLSEGIADNVNTINTGLRSLEKMMKQIGGPNDSVQLRDKIHDTQQTVNGSVSATARDIQRLGVVVRRGDKPQKLQVERLTQAFRDALAKYSSVQKQVSEKMAAHMPRPARVRNDPQALEQQAIADDEESTLLANQQAQARLVQFETSMLLEKEAYINKIEADVLDVNQIIQELADMVNQQAQSVDTVESHIESVSANVEAGVDELAKAAEYQLVQSYLAPIRVQCLTGYRNAAPRAAPVIVKIPEEVDQSNLALVLSSLMTMAKPVTSQNIPAYTKRRHAALAARMVEVLLNDKKCRFDTV